VRSCAIVGLDAEPIEVIALVNEARNAFRGAGGDNRAGSTHATGGAAIMNGMDDRIGTLKAGKEGDVIVVDGNPLEDLGDLERVQMTFVRGCCLYSRSEVA